jgi:hypothetical protein
MLFISRPFSGEAVVDRLLPAGEITRRETSWQTQETGCYTALQMPGHDKLALASPGKILQNPQLDKLDTNFKQEVMIRWT